MLIVVYISCNSSVSVHHLHLYVPIFYTYTYPNALWVFFVVHLKKASVFSNTLTQPRVNVLRLEMCKCKY